MIIKESIKTTNSILQKANDFKYFALLGSFVLILDFTLVMYYGVALIDLSFGFVKNDVSVGSVLIFFAMFSLFISFVVGTFRSVLIGIFQFVPYNIIRFFSKNDFYEKNEEIHYLTINELKRFAIKNNNNVAYSMYLNWQEEKKSESLLEQYSLAFLMASILNAYVSFTLSDNTILSFSFLDKSNLNEFSIDLLIIFLTIILYVGFIYIGIFRGCGLALRDYGRNRFYIYNHGIKT